MEKAFYVRIDKETHSEVKRLAAFKYTTIENWIRQAITEKLLKEKGYLKDKIIP